ncbi:MAG: hypothetical protein SFV24_19000 [Gemmatimonadales bacterium]|nr:hypothetical protein [Gemmatimonadales bacterium]
MQSPELQNQIAQWRARAIAGTLTPDEMKAAVAALREGRRSASETAAKPKKSSSGGKSKAPARSADDLLNELDSL